LRRARQILTDGVSTVSPRLLQAMRLTACETEIGAGSPSLGRGFPTPCGSRFARFGYWASACSTLKGPSSPCRVAWRKDEICRPTQSRVFRQDASARIRQPSREVSSMARFARTTAARNFRFTQALSIAAGRARFQPQKVAGETSTTTWRKPDHRVVSDCASRARRDRMAHRTSRDKGRKRHA